MATRTDVTRRLRNTRLPAGIPRYGARSNLRRRRDYAVLLTGEPTPPPTTPAPAGEAEAMGMPPFGRAVALVANAVAGTEWHAKRWDPDLGVDVRLADQPLVVLDPDPLSTPWHYKWATIEDGILFGNAFALPGDLDFRTSRPGWLVPVAADEVWILFDPSRPAWWQWVIGGVTFDPGELLHIPFGNRSGEILGRGVLAQYGDWLGGAVAAETHAGSYFAGGALPPAVLQSPTVLTDTQAFDLKAKWREMTNTREPVILPTGYVLTPLVSNAEQAQLVESRQWNAQLVAQLVGVPAWKLDLPQQSMTYQNVETADIDFVRDCVDRWARPITASFTKWLLPRGTSLVWDYAGRMRADQKTTSEVLTTYTGAGILSVDEARAVIGRPPAAAAVEAGSTPAGTPELTPEEVST